MKLKDELKTMKLKTYENLALQPVVEEPAEDIKVAVLYHDHGDDYLYIQTKEGKRFEYGFWCNLLYATPYEELKPVDDPESEFLRNPLLFPSKINVNGYDGIAGKKLNNDLYLSGDGVHKIWINGEAMDLNKIIYSTSDYEDDWGYPTYHLPLDQFEDNALLKYREDVVNSLRELENYINDVRENLNNRDLQDLLDIRGDVRESLCKFRFLTEE